MKKMHCLVCTIGFVLAAPLLEGATITVNTTDNEFPFPGETNLVQAISLLADGDTIAFNIPEAGPHYIVTPATGYPYITNHNVTIDGYTQPGSAANTNTILGSNTAVIKIVLDSTAGGGTAGEFFDGENGTPGFSPGSLGILFAKGATNVHIRGLSFMGNESVVGIAVDGRSHHFHLSGCWVGVDPDGSTVSFMDTGVAVQGHNNGSGFGFVFATNATIGVAAGTANVADARAQFNVIGRHVISLALQGRNMRFSGNFLVLLPDGMTDWPDFPVDSVFENGRGGNNLVFGTDGDGINDAEERNIVGGVREADDSYIIGIYGGGGPEAAATNMVFAGNYFGVAVDGVTRLPNASVRIFEFGGTTPQARVGSDFNGVSDALEANKIYNSLNFEMAAGGDNSRWISLRRNELVNNTRLPLDPAEGAAVYNKFMNEPFKPVITDLTTSLSGTCGTPVGDPYTRLIVDVYLPDPEGDSVSDPQGKTWLASFLDNSSADSDPAVGAFTFNLETVGAIVSGTKLTIAVTYSGDTQPQITSATRSGGNTTLTLSGGTPNYNIERASVVTGPYTTAAVATGDSITFADPAATSFYRVRSGSSSGQTSPFADSVAVP